jgi:hypothetical protein
MIRQQATDRANSMGKRSDFERKPRDFYPTPLAAVLPLLPHLPQGFSYVEPCAGDGALCRALGRDPVFACDISPQWDGAIKADAMLLTAPLMWADFIITNPPWDRKILHPMIERFSDFCPTWLLFDADWMHTKQSAPFMPRLRKIVSVGRVKWIPDSKMTGKDNCAWYLFDTPNNKPTEFAGR